MTQIGCCETPSTVTHTFEFDTDEERQTNDDMYLIARANQAITTGPSIDYSKYSVSVYATADGMIVTMIK